eukprot:1318993-Pyramimonas_sp.AAC.1
MCRPELESWQVKANTEHSWTAGPFAIVPGNATSPCLREFILTCLQVAYWVYDGNLIAFQSLTPTD